MKPQESPRPGGQLPHETTGITKARGPKPHETTGITKARGPVTPGISEKNPYSARNRNGFVRNTPGWVWRCDAAISRYSQKTCLFGRFFTFFHVQPKYQNDAIFVHIEGLRPCLSKPSYGAPKWALMVRLMQNKRPKSRQKSLFQKTGSFGDVTETAILAIFASHFLREFGCGVTLSLLFWLNPLPGICGSPSGLGGA